MDLMPENPIQTKKNKNTKFKVALIVVCVLIVCIE